MYVSMRGWLEVAVRFAHVPPFVLFFVAFYAGVQDKVRYTREIAAYKAWFVRTQGSKENKAAVASAVASAAGKATSSTAQVTPMARSVAPSGTPVSVKLNVGVSAPVPGPAPAPAQAPVTITAAGGMATVFATSVRPYSSAEFSGASAAGLASLSHSPIFTSSSSSYSQASSPPLPPLLSPSPPMPATAPTVHSPPMKRMKREEPVFDVANVVAVAPKVSESVLDVVAEGGVETSHRAHDGGGVRGDSGIVVVSSAPSPHVRV